MFRATNSPIFRITFDCIYSFGTMHWYCCQPVTRLRRNCSSIKADLNRSIKGSIKENCCILLVAYVVFLTIYGHTNVKLISYDKEVYIDNNLDNYMRITSINNSTFRPQKTPKKTQIKLYNTLVLLTLLHGGENGNIKARDARRITTAEMKYMRKTVGYTWTDYKTDTETVQN